MTFDEWFRDFNTWGLGHDDLLRLAFTPGVGAGDTVWTSPTGREMTRHVCSRWIDFYGAAQAGWNAAAKAMT
jgi:hypothetical protein